jgi:hypothetical protein
MFFGPFLFIPPGIPLAPTGPATGEFRHPGESLVDCVNRCLTNRGLEARVTTHAIELCGLGMVAVGAPAPGPVTALTAPLALAGCLTFATGYDIGITADCLGRCGERPPEEPGMVAALPHTDGGGAFAVVADDMTPPTTTGSIVVNGVSPVGMQLAMNQQLENAARIAPVAQVSAHRRGG